MLRLMWFDNFRKIYNLLNERYEQKLIAFKQKG